MRFSSNFSRTRATERLSALRVDKRLTAGIAATVLVTGAATGTAVALTSSDNTPHTAAASTAGTQAATRATNDTASRSEQRTALDPQTTAKTAAAAAQAKAAAAKTAAAAAAAQAKAKADTQAKAAAAAKAQAAAQAKTRAAAAAAAAKAKAAATPTYANNLNGWIAQARAILAAHGDKVPSADAIHARAMTESSGNPRAENHWDSNQALYGGTYGLVQTIKPTFAHYSLPGHKDIMNPVDSIIAGVRYANATYGDFTKIAYTKSGY
jgi:hypothetical protein